MTWGIHSVAFGDIGDYASSDAYFTKGYSSYVRGPFRSWHEGYGDFGGVTTFITGAGGWLQALTAGYGGLRLSNAGLEIRSPRPPPNCTGIRLRNIFFLGNLIQVECAVV